MSAGPVDAPAPTPPTPVAPVRPAPRVSVVFSFWNEEDVLAELVRRCRAVFDAETAAGHVRGYELIFVNDASTDGSEALLRREALVRPDIRIVNTSRNFGVSPCVLAGMSFATGDVVVYMDADLQDPPEVIPQMLAAWRAEPDVDVVHTVRLSRSGETRLKLWITRQGYRILKAVSTIDLPPEAGDFKLLSRRAVDHLLSLREQKPFIRGLVCWIGFKQRKVHYHRDARFSGATKFPVLGIKVLRNFLDSAFISFSDVPLKLSIFAGLASSAASLGYIFWVLIEKYRGHNIPGWSAIMVAVLFLGGVQLLSVGILGLYVNAIFLEVKGRPLYLVKDTFGFEPTAASPAATESAPRIGDPPSAPEPSANGAVGHPEPPGRPERIG